MKISRQSEDVISARPACLLWSGGADSTAILANRLAAGVRTRTLSVTTKQVPQTVEDRAARKRIAKTLKVRGFRWEHAEVTVKSDRNGDMLPSSDGMSCQPSLWLSVAIARLRDDEDLILGYIKPDGIWHRINDLQAAFAALARLTGKSGKLVLPYEWMGKEDVIEDLRQVKLISQIWYCENPVKRRGKSMPCRKCACCKIHQRGIEDANAAR